MMRILRLITKNWKTSLIGVGTGAGIAFLKGVQEGLSPKDAAIAVGLAALGLVAKDSNVSGN